MNQSLDPPASAAPTSALASWKGVATALIVLWGLLLILDQVSLLGHLGPPLLWLASATIAAGAIAMASIGLYQIRAGTLTGHEGWLTAARRVGLHLGLPVFLAATWFEIRWSYLIGVLFVTALLADGLRLLAEGYAARQLTRARLVQGGSRIVIGLAGSVLYALLLLEGMVGVPGWLKNGLTGLVLVGFLGFAGSEIYLKAQWLWQRYRQWREPR